MHYHGLIFSPDAENDEYGFMVPDVKGFFAQCGGTLDDALKEAQAAFNMHISAIIDAGMELPAPRDLSALQADRDLADEFAEMPMIYLFPVLMPGGRTKKLTISMDEFTIDLIDRQARMRGMTRSGLLAEGARRLAREEDEGVRAHG